MTKRSAHVLFGYGSNDTASVTTIVLLTIPIVNEDGEPAKAHHLAYMPDKYSIAATVIAISWPMM